jgi:hypothetical protein
MKILLSALFSIALTATAFAQTLNDTLFVGAYHTDQIFRYDQNGNIIQPDPWIGPGGNAVNSTGIQGEGIAVGENFPTTGGYAFGDVSEPIYIVNFNTETVEVANGNAAAGTNPIVNASFITGLNEGANLALSTYGQTLYLAQQNANSVTEYNALTGAVITSVTGITDAHDVVVAANGNVFVTAYGPGLTTTVGVLEFDKNLNNEQTFIAANYNTGGGTTLNHPTGMTFDASGNLWVANVYAQGGTVIGQPVNAEDFVAEFSSTGTLIRTIEATGNHLYTVFGLSLGPDGNIYAASFNGDEITEINTTTFALSTFATLPAAGDEPKYGEWGSDVVSYSTVPEPRSYGLLSLCAVLLFLGWRRFQQTQRSVAGW